MREQRGKTFPPHPDLRPEPFQIGVDHRDPPQAVAPKADQGIFPFGEEGHFAGLLGVGDHISFEVRNRTDLPQEVDIGPGSHPNLAGEPPLAGCPLRLPERHPGQFLGVLHPV